LQKTPQPKPRMRAPQQPISNLPLKPSHRQILEATGWLSFVEAHIDVLRYYPWPAFATESGPAWGLAMCTTGQRVAHVALEGRSDRDVVATIVHEAAHLAGLHEIGRMHDQRYAEAITAQFLATFDALQRKKSCEVPRWRAFT
jgi:hypothetical protein